MKAILCTRYGPPEVLQLAEVPEPVPQDNEIRVKIHATTVNIADTRTRSFSVPPLFWVAGRLGMGLTRPNTPILGMTLAGEVESTGGNVSRFKVGNRVFASIGHSGMGGYAEYKCLGEDDKVTIIPEGISYEEAAAIPMAGTSLWFLRKGKVRSGQKVLIYGASGTLGTYAVQLAKHFGAEVTGVCSTANLELVQSLGADKVVDYTLEDITKSHEVYDVIFETVDKISMSRCRNILKRGGYFLDAVLVLAPVFRLWHSVTSGRNIVGGESEVKTEDLDYLKGLVAAGKLKVVIDRTYPLEQIVEAHRYVDTGHKKGNVVITVGRGDNPGNG